MSEERIAADFAAMGVDPAPEPAPSEPAVTGTAADLAPLDQPAVVPETPAPDAPAEPVEPTVPDTPARPTAADRIHELTAARRAERQAREAAERQNRELRETLDRMNATLERLAPATPAVTAPTETARPQRQDFDDPDAYQVALTDWATERHTRRIAAEFEKREDDRRREAEAAAARQRQEEQQRTVHQGYQTRRADFMKEHPDYIEVAENETTPASGPMLQVLLTHDQGPAMAYWLGQNQDEAARIANLPDPAMQLVEMGMIAASLRRPAAQPVNPRPAPIVPIRSTGSAAPRSINDMSMEEIDQMYKNEMIAKAKSGGRS